VGVEASGGLGAWRALVGVGGCDTGGAVTRWGL